MFTRSKATRFMSLPIEIKSEILQYLNQKNRLKIRLTCKLLKACIDNYVGINAIINEPSSKTRQSKKLNFLGSIALRKVWIENLQFKLFNEVFRYPQYLEVFHVRQEVTNKFIQRAMNECINLKELQIIEKSKQSLHSEDFNEKVSTYRKLQRLTLTVDQKLLAESQLSIRAENILVLLEHIRSPIVEKLYFDSTITNQCNSMKTMTTLEEFLERHAGTIRNLLIGLTHNIITNKGTVEKNTFELLKKKYITLCEGKKFKQRAITLVNLNIEEFSLFYEVLKVQTELEKLTVTNWTGRTQGWQLYWNIIPQNVKTLKRIHLSIECPTPFDFSIFENCHQLRELAVFANTTGLVHDQINGVNLTRIPKTIKLLIVSNFLVRTEEFKELDLPGLEILSIIQIHGLGVNGIGLKVNSVQSILSLRNLRAALLCGIWLPTTTEITQMHAITSLMSNQATFFFKMDSVAPSFQYWTLKPRPDNQNADLTFHLPID